MTSYLFPSPEWVAGYRDALNASDEYRDAASTWHHGAIAMVVPPSPELGLPEGFALWLDVDGGQCQAARVVTLEEAKTAPFCLTASYPRWRDVISNRLDPIAGMITRRIALQGSLVTMIRYVRSAKAMVRCATQVPTRFMEPALPQSVGVASLQGAS